MKSGDFKGSAKQAFSRGLIYIRTIILISIFLVALSGPSEGAVVDLGTLLDSAGDGDTISLDAANTYSLGLYDLNKSIKIEGNGATVEMNGGPFSLVKGGATLTIEYCIFEPGTAWPDPPPWGMLAARNGSTLIVSNSSVKGPGIPGPYPGDPRPEPGEETTGIFGGEGSTLTITDSSLEDLTYGIQIWTGSSGDIKRCSFQRVYWGGVIVNHEGSYASFSQSTVDVSREDGVFFWQSSGVVEESQFIDCEMTGVTFVDCPDGGTVKNCLIRNCGDQGLVVARNTMIPDPGEGTQNVSLLSNTVINSKGCGLWIDYKSEAVLQGNIFWQGPQESAGIRLHGPQGITVDSALVIGSYYGMEINNGSNPKIVLTSVRENDFTGILAWNSTSSGPQLTMEQCYLWKNNRDPASWPGWTLNTVNDASATVHYSTFGAMYDNGVLGYGGTYCDVTSNYWGAANGPAPPGGTGSGAKVDGTNVHYLPYLTSSPVDNAVKTDLSLSPGGVLSWDSGLNITLNLTGKADGTAVTGEIAGVLRVNNTAHLNHVTPPNDLISGQIYVAWISTTLRMNSASGYLEFNVPEEVAEAGLASRQSDGSWSQVSADWDPASHLLTYSPSDVHLLNGTFALIETAPGTAYVEPSGYCGGKYPCFSDIQDAVDYSSTAATDIMIGEGYYTGDIGVEGSQDLTFQCGWDPSFTGISSESRVNGKMTLKGTVTLSRGTLVLE